MWPLQSHRPLAAGLALILILAAPCCGNPCSTSLIFNAPPPDMHLAAGDTASYELFQQVWTLDHCYVSQSFPDVIATSNDTRVATAYLEDTGHNRPSRLHVTAHAPGKTVLLLHLRTEIDCEMVADATHFTVTVSPADPTLEP